MKPKLIGYCWWSLPYLPTIGIIKKHIINTSFKFVKCNKNKNILLGFSVSSAIIGFVESSAAGKIVFWCLYEVGRLSESGTNFMLAAFLDVFVTLCNYAFYWHLTLAYYMYSMWENRFFKEMQYGLIVIVQF